ncbi:MAG: zinc-ribbon domain-containing protein [Burkholderiales bacterium]
MKCARCSTENPASAKFCRSCGTPIAAPQADPQPPGAVLEAKSAGLRITPTAIGIVVLLLISVVGIAYVGLSWYEDSTRVGETARGDERAIEEKRRKAEQDRLADEQQKAVDAEREKQRQQADAQQAMKLARDKAEEDDKKRTNEAAAAARDAEDKAKRAEAKPREEQKARDEAKAREQAKAREEAKAKEEAKAREQAKAKEEAKARELARAREEKAAQAREARARQSAATTSTAAKPVETQVATPALAQPAPAVVAQAPAPAPAQNDPCAGLSGLKREQCTSCNRHTGLRKSACEDRAMDRYCEGKWNKPGSPDCVDPRRR